MDRVFLEYYDDELTHIRELAREFADMHPAVARNLSLDTVPCPDPYVERLLEGVAYLAARTRIKVDGEGTRFARNTLETLYPDLAGPAPAASMAVLVPGPQVLTMPEGHVVPHGTRLVSGLRDGLATRATYTTAQDVTLWPIRIESADYLQDRSALAAAGIRSVGGPGGDSALRLTIAAEGAASLAQLSLDRLDICLAGRPRAAALFDAFFGVVGAVGARPAGTSDPLIPVTGPAMTGIADDEALLPRSRATFEGYRLLREYFLMPERFHFARFEGLRPVIRTCATSKLEIIIMFRRACPELADISAADFTLFATPVINLFVRDCDVIEIDERKSQQVLHADRTRSRDFEIYRVTSVENADADGPDAAVPPAFGTEQPRSSGYVYSTERRPRRPGEDERRDGQTRTSYAGDDMFIAVSRPYGGEPGKPLDRVAVRALCTNRDLSILDDNPALTLESGDPVSQVRLLSAMHPPRPSLPASLPRSMSGESRQDDLAWRLIGQLSLDFLSLADTEKGAEPLLALLALYADRGDPALARHARAVTRISARPVTERLNIPGPICFGRGTEITLHIDENTLSGHSNLLLPALLDRLFARYAGVNSFVRTRVHLMQKQEVLSWPMVPGNRALI